MLNAGDVCPECGEKLTLSTGPGRTQRYRGRECALPADFSFAACQECGAEWLDGSQVTALSKILEEAVTPIRQDATGKG